jgi:hypothetical protein
MHHDVHRAVAAVVLGVGGRYLMRLGRHLWKGQA